MQKTYKYHAFGLNIESFVPIAQITQRDFDRADVTIAAADFSMLSAKERRLVGENTVFFRVPEIGRFRITNGSLIQVQLEERYKQSVLAVYLMGSCMGAILIQRDFMLLHGSCVTDGSRAILITGDSGAGKSTLAAEFLKNGWKLITDDVTAVFDVEGTPKVRSSYPSQKLWQDALDRYERPAEDIHSLYFTEEREKFGVSVASSFFEGECPLSMVVRLVPADHPCTVDPIVGIGKVDQLMRNTYRLFFIEDRHRQQHFQRCVTLSTKVPMALTIRENGKQCADTLYDLITEHLGGIKHD